MDYDKGLFIVQGMGIFRAIWAMTPTQEARLAELAGIAIGRLQEYEAKEHKRLCAMGYHAKGLYDKVSAYIVKALTLAEMREVREILQV